jgi:SAM-dependent methyltransferase
VRHDTVWQQPELVETFINDVRGGVPYAADQIAAMLRVIQARRSPVRRVADLGCGAGVLARAILAAYPDAHAVLVDFSEPMLAAARTALAAHRPAPVFLTADLAEPGWRNELSGYAPFDVIASGYAIHHLTNARKRALYAEIFALLSPGGWFVNVEHVASATPHVAAISDELLIDSIHGFQRGKGSTVSREQVAHDFVHRPDKAANILAAVEQQCQWLRDIGYADVDCFFKVFELAVFGGRR